MVTRVKAEIVPAKLAIKAMMDSGYKNAAYALAELMDNSIQAGAKIVELLCVEKMKEVDVQRRARIEQIAVLDNGSGMDQDTLRFALQFGNGTHLDEAEQTGMGKFGMGLPSASISQARKVEVWTWQNGPDSAIYSYLDVNEIISGEMDEIPEPKNKKIPKIWLRAATSIGESGTLVVWTGLDRCIWKTGEGIIKNSELLIGRMYRKFLHKNKVKIRMATFDGDRATFDLKGEDQFAKPNDPLYLMENTSTPDPYDKVPMFDPWPSKDNYETSIDVHINKKVHKVIIRTAMAKAEARNEGTAGSRSYGHHAKRNIGVSILRAGRELDLDSSWASFGNPKERWWGLEVEFPPALDGIFGVTNNKQYASHFAEMAKINVEDWLKDEGKTIVGLQDELIEDNDPKGPLLQITHTIRENIRQMRGLIDVQNKNSRTREKRERYGTPVEIEATAKTRILQGEGHVGTSDEGELRPPEVRRVEIENALIDSGISETDAKAYAGSTIDKSLKYLFVEAPLDNPAFFSVQPRGGAIMLTLNTNHSAYDRLVDVLEKEGDEENSANLQERLDNALNGLKLLLMAWARYEDEQPSSQARQKAQEARIDWGRMARRFLDRDE
jgi:Histidine kinase-, DNA gyrase B-, and HSP90-like ATPase